jgi:hypothetical protein
MTDSTDTLHSKIDPVKRAWRVILPEGKHCSMIEETEVKHAVALESARHRFDERCLGVE